MRHRTAMELSGLCGSDRLGTSSTSSETALPMLPCNIEAKEKSNSLANWHVACCIRCARHKQWALCGGRVWRGAVPPGPPRRSRGGREKPSRGRRTTTHHQEIFLVGAARRARGADCLSKRGGPCWFGERTMAEAM